MRAPARLGLYAAALAAVFAAAFLIAGALVPPETVQSWSEETSDHSDDHAGNGEASSRDHTGALAEETSASGLSLESDGYLLTGVTAPTEIAVQDALALTVQGPDGAPVTDFELSHEKELHLIVVRADGAGFRHVHPERDENGRWSIAWEWQAAGSYRVYADFVPAATGEDTTLSTVVQVGGDVTPSYPSGPVTRVETDGYEVNIGGDLAPGEASTLTISITREGEPVTSLEPYLGAYGHLVALREGDLAYLHVHPHGEAPHPGETSGPEVVFEVTAPTPGRYLLYLDFQIAGAVHTAELVLDADVADAGGSTPGDESNDTETDHDDETGHAEEDGHDHDE